MSYKQRKNTPDYKMPKMTLIKFMIKILETSRIQVIHLNIIKALYKIRGNYTKVKGKFYV